MFQISRGTQLSLFVSSVIILSGCAYSKTADLKHVSVTSSRDLQVECLEENSCAVTNRPVWAFSKPQCDKPAAEKPVDFSRFKGFSRIMTSIMEEQRQIVERMAEDRYPVRVKKRINKYQVAIYLKEAGFPAQVIPAMVCTARYESSFRPHVRHVNKNGSSDYGLFQINERWQKACGASRYELLNPKTNSRCAYKVWRKQGMQAWFAYKRKRNVCKLYEKDKQLLSTIAMHANPRKK